MKSQQAAEREEQQRIKNLVLNYDLNDDDQHDGSIPPSLIQIVQPSLGSKKLAKNNAKIGYDHFNNSLSRSERHSRAPRARRLNLSDVDWYGRQASDLHPSSPQQENYSKLPALLQNKKKPG